MKTLVISGKVAIKKNRTQRKYSFAKRRTITMPSDAYLAWADRAVLELRSQWHQLVLEVPLVAVYRFYFKDHRGEPDTSNCIEGPQDVLKKAGIISDDKIIMRVIAEKFFGEEPRTEIELYEYNQTDPNLYKYPEEG